MAHINKLFFCKRHICIAQKAPRRVVYDRLGMQTPRLTYAVNKTGPSAARDDKGGGTSISFLFYSVASWSCGGVDEAGVAPNKGLKLQQYFADSCLFFAKSLRL